AAMVEGVAALAVAAVAISGAGGAILVGLAGIALRATVLPAIASRRTRERAFRSKPIIFGTEIIFGTREDSFLETPFSMITHTGMTIRTMAIMTKMPRIIPGSLLPCRGS